MERAERSLRYRVVGMDCARDAAAVERAVGAVPGVQTVRVSAASHVMILETAPEPSAMRSEVAAAVAALGYRLEPFEHTSGETTSAGDVDRGAAHEAPSYRRALWTVVVLNVGYGVFEMIGGFLADSQAVKADALDFVGDGVITLLGLLAIGWSLAWRARAALFQGVFLALLGMGVLVNTAYRLLIQEQPEAAAMGFLGLIAFVVNVASAAVLLPHRTGDANVRAVWLFSRNDAIGNAAVVVAAGFVAWLRTPWPDLVVAAVIASLFLHSSWSIVRDARADLRDSGGA